MFTRIVCEGNGVEKPVDGSRRSIRKETDFLAWEILAVGAE